MIKKTYLILFYSLIFSATGNFIDTGNLPEDLDNNIFDNLIYNKQFDVASIKAHEFSNNKNHLPFERLAMLYLKFGMLDSCAIYTNKTMDIVYKQENYKEITNIDQILNKFSQKFKSANKSQERGLNEEAIREYNEILSILPDFSAAIYNIGNIYYSNRNLDRAVTFIYKASQINPVNTNYAIMVNNISKQYYKEAEKQRKQKRYAEALDNYNKSVKYFPEFATAWFQMARVLYAQKEIDNSLVALNKCIEYRPDHYQAFKLKGDILYKRKRDNIAATDAYSSAISIKPDYYQAFYSRGNIFLATQSFEKAISDYLQCVNIKPDYSKAYIALGIGYMNISDFDNSIKNLLISLDLDSRSYESYFRLSQLYSKKENFEKAKFYAKNALDIKPNYSDAIYEIALSEIGLCNKFAAKEYLNKLKTDRRYRSNANNYLKNFNFYTKHCK